MAWSLQKAFEAYREEVRIQELRWLLSLAIRAVDEAKKGGDQ